MPRLVEPYRVPWLMVALFVSGLAVDFLVFEKNSAPLPMMPLKLRPRAGQNEASPDDLLEDFLVQLRRDG